MDAEKKVTKPKAYTKLKECLVMTEGESCCKWGAKSWNLVILFFHASFHSSFQNDRPQIVALDNCQSQLNGTNSDMMIILVAALDRPIVQGLLVRLRGSRYGEEMRKLENIGRDEISGECGYSRLSVRFRGVPNSGISVVLRSGYIPTNHALTTEHPVHAIFCLVCGIGFIS